MPRAALIKWFFLDMTDGVTFGFCQQDREIHGKAQGNLRGSNGGGGKKGVNQVRAGANVRDAKDRFVC